MRVVIQPARNKPKIQLELDQQEKGRKMSQTVTLDEFQAHEIRVAVSMGIFELSEFVETVAEDEHKAELEARIAVLDEVLELIQITYPNYQQIEKRK